VKLDDFDSASIGPSSFSSGMERVGESEWEPVVEPSWQAHLEPTDLVCVVCLLQLNGLEELRDVDLPTQPLDVDAGDLNDLGISFEEYARNEKE
jgi:hypothetical protein